MTAPYRVYIAAAATPDQIERVKLWSTKLTSAGLVVVSTWPDVVSAVGAANPRDATTDQRRTWSEKDLQELDSAEALWLMCPPPGTQTRGAWVELGYAYARSKQIVSSGDVAQSIFTALGGGQYADDKDAHEWLLLVASGRHR